MDAITNTLRESPAIIYAVIFNAFQWFAILGVAVIVVWRLSRVRKNPDAPLLPFLEAFLVFLALGPLPLGIYSWRIASEQLVSASAGHDASQLASNLAAAISTQGNTDGVLLLQLLSVGSVAAALFAVALYARLVTLRDRLPAVGALGAGLMLLSIPCFCAGALTQTSKLISAFSAIALADPADKASLLRYGIEQSRFLRDFAYPAAIGCVLFGAVLVGARLWLGRVQAKRPGIAVGLSVVALVIAGALVREARPYAQENALPIPYSAEGKQISSPEAVKTPALRGPDPVKRAPLLVVSEELIALEGFVLRDRADLSSKLAEIRKVDEMMRPGSGGSRLLVAVDERVQASRLMGVLAAARGAKYRQASFLFITFEDAVTRPILGKKRVQRESAVDGVQLGDSSKAELVKVAPTERFGDLARRVLEARKRSGQIRLVLTEGERSPRFVAANSQGARRFARCPFQRSSSR